MRSYDSTAIEKKWQDYWKEKSTYRTLDTVDGKENFYALSEFAYPSGNLHVGHWYAFAVPDIYARYKRMQGYNVLYPMGFDAFGLPAENAAIKRGLDPRKWTYENMNYMQNQLQSMGASFDWSRKIVTCDPDYYKWTQWMFNQFFKNDLVYRASTKTNWCESCKTILANEQVTDGKCERCGNQVIQKDMNQWMLRITNFADALHDDLDTLPWDHSIKQAQREWIGRKEGSNLSFKINNFSQKIDVFTTRADTLFGVTYVVLAPEHKLVQQLKSQIQNWDEVQKYLDDVAKKSDLDRQQSKEKTGVALKGINAINPGTGEEIPVWIADYVLAHFGTGAVMAVPAHDERDAEFAIEYNLPFKFVVLPSAGEIGNSRQLEVYGETAGIKAAGAIEEPGQKRINAEWNYMYDVLSAHTDGILPAGKRFCCSFEGKLINSPSKELDGYVFLGFNHPRDDKEWKEKKRVYAVVKQRGSEMYLGLKSLTDAVQGLITGGIDNGENPEDTVIREILEETGYNATIISRESYKIYDKYYTTNKDINISSHGDVFLLEVEDVNDIKEIAEEESIKAEAIWMTKNEFINWINPPSHKFILEKLFKLKEPCGNFNAKTSQEARPLITDSTDGSIAKTYRLRDWGISRQRYWGTPIPIVYDPEGKAHAIPDEYLPWILPEDVDYTPDGTAPLDRSVELKKRTIEIFGAGWTPEVDTMDAFVDSSWYFYRYLDSKNSDAFVGPEVLKKWMPVNKYFGGAEHTTMHLLYSRFWVKALHSLNLVPKNEPYHERLNRGIILGPDGNKMSKSKGNVIDPDEVVSHVGADSVRMYLAFIGPFNEPGNYPWDPNGVVGMRRFIERVWRLSEKISDEKTSIELVKMIHKTIKKVTEDIERLKLNTAISSMMVLVNNAEKESHILKSDYSALLKMFACFAPHVAEELWQEILGNKRSIHLQVWPEFDESLTLDNKVTLGVQINGKVRAEITIPVTADSQSVQKSVLEIEAIVKWVGGKEIKKFIYVPKKIINIVL